MQSTVDAPPLGEHRQTSSVRRRRAIKRPAVKESLLVLGFFTVVATVATWPLAIKPLAGFYGFGNDNLGGANVYGWVHDSLFGPGGPGFNPNLQAPFGYDVPLHAMQPMDWVYTVVFGGPRGGMVVANAQVFSSFIFAGATAYLLVRHLTGSKPASLVGGFIFTFSPYHLAIGQQYGALASIQWVPLYVLALLRVIEHPTRSKAAQAGAALALIGLTSFYYLWFAMWFTMLLFACFGLMTAWKQWRVHHRLPLADVRSFVGCIIRRGLLGGVVFSVLFLPFAIPTLSTLSASESDSVDHPLAEAVRYSGKPIMLVLPPHDNPLLGRFSKSVIYRNLFDMPVYEQSTYLGIVASLLAVAAFVPLWRRRQADNRSLTPAANDGADHQESVTVSGRALLLAGLLVGFALYIGPYLPLESTYWRDHASAGSTSKLPWIGLLMFHVNGTFRFYSRNFVLISTCLAALAGVGAASVMRRLPSVRRQWAVAGLLIVATGAEFTNAPPQRFTDAEFPHWVRQVEVLESDASIVDYPLAPANSPRSLYYLFWQARHERATVNPSQTNEARAFAATIRDPDSAEAGQALYDAGIDYAIMHTRLPPATTPPYQPSLPDDSVARETGSENPWFVKVIETDDAVIYRIRKPA